jgi:nicotinamide-nucleotide amidase
MRQNATIGAYRCAIDHPPGGAMERLLPLARRASDLLRARRESIAVAESSTAGLVSAALVAIPGASAYYLGGGVIYTAAAQRGLLAIPREALRDLRASTEPYARLGARTIRDRLSSTWGIAETGASGPTGNPYGDAAGHSCIAIAGPLERSLTLETGRSDRVENMYAFSEAALMLLIEGLETAPRA